MSIHNKYCMCHFRLSAKRPSQLPPAHSAENMAPAQNMLMINPAFQVQCVQWGYPQIIHLNRIVHYKPSILETPILGNLHVALIIRKKMGNMHETMDSSQGVQVNSLKTILGQPLESSTWKLRRWMGEGTSSNIWMNIPAEVSRSKVILGYLGMVFSGSQCQRVTFRWMSQYRRICPGALTGSLLKRFTKYLGAHHVRYKVIGGNNITKWWYNTTSGSSYLYNHTCTRYDIYIYIYIYIYYVIHLLYINYRYSKVYVVFRIPIYYQYYRGNAASAVHPTCFIWRIPLIEATHHEGTRTTSAGPITLWLFNIAMV